MAITKTEHPFPNLTGGMIVKSTIPVFLIGSADTTTLTARMAVEAKGGTTSNADAKQFVYGSANSKRIIGWVTHSILNKITLAENNQNPTMSTAFAADDKVEIAMRIPVCEALLTTGSGTTYAGQRYVCAGAGLLKPHPDDLYDSLVQSTGWGFPTSTGSGNMPLDPTCAIGLSLTSTADAVQTIQIMPMW